MNRSRCATIGALLLLASVLTTPILATTTASAAGPGSQRCGPAGGPSDELTVTGWVGTERTYDAADLAALPQTTVADTYLAGSGTTSRNYTGVDLWRLLELPATSGGIGTLLRPSAPTGPQGASQRNDVTRYAVMVTGSDCFQATYAMSEVSPFFGGKPVVVATAQGAYDPSSTTPVTDPLGADGFARISNPSDVRGSRRVSNIVEVRVLQAPAETSAPPTTSPTCTPGPSTSLTVDGWVTAPTTYDAAALAALPQTTVADTYLAGSGSTSANYTGVDLWRLLGLPESSGGIGTLIRPGSPGPQAPMAQRNDLTRYSVMVTATDCFQALFSLAEISPFFGGRPVLVATRKGAYAPGSTTPVSDPLGTEGFARISIPKDVRGSRRVSNIAEIRVLRAPTPIVAWDTPAPVPAGTPLGADQLDALASYDGAPVAGSFVYDPPAGTVLEPGTHELSGLFVPTGPSSVTLARGTVTLTVLPPPVATELAEQAPGVLVAGRTGTVRTTLTAGGVPLAGAALDLVATAGGVATTVATATTDAQGVATAPVGPLVRTSYEWRYAGDAEHAPATSAPTLVQVRTALTLDLPASTVTTRQVLRASGTVTPAQPGRTVLLVTPRDGGRVLARATVAADGTFEIARVVRRAGLYRVYAGISATGANLAGTSPVRGVRVTRCAGPCAS